MAALVNAISVVGLVNEMNGDGIYFDEVEAEFRLTPGRMTLTRGSAVGASLGLSMDGVFATDTGQIAMQGVITPVYLINGVGSLLTRKGEGIAGLQLQPWRGGQISAGLDQPAVGAGTGRAAQHLPPAPDRRTAGGRRARAPDTARAAAR